MRATLLLALAMAACADSASAPQPIALGEARCARCQNVIRSLDAAAQAVAANEAPRFYDDLGCLALDPTARRPGMHLYVQIAGGKGWSRVEDVAFASPPGTRTPQGYNYLAYPEDEARTLASDHWARGWNDLTLELVKKR